MTSTIVEIKDLKFGFGRHSRSNNLIFDGLSLSVSAGEHIAIVGDSGGGKSTLLKLIADGQQTAIKRSSSSITMVMQEGALLDHLSIINNLRLVARYANETVGEERVKHALTQLNVDENLHDANVSRLSGGQRRRVAIARALLTEPQLMLFDEPDAGLDIANLNNLANAVTPLSALSGKACITVSHNPFYLSQVANKVYRLQQGKLVLIADWPSLPESETQRAERQHQLQSALSINGNQSGLETRVKQAPQWPVLSWLNGIVLILRNIVHWPKSWRDELQVAAYGFYLSFLSGALFFALVGMMLGSTTIAVVKMLSDNALTGVVRWFIKPERLIEMMGGRYVLYLAPAIGGMLFAARSGSIMSNWLGEMVRGRQIQALSLLGVPPQQYLGAPSVLALFTSMFATIVWFAFCVWLGGLLTTQQLFTLKDPMSAMSLSGYDISASLFWLKTFIYSVLVAVTVVSLGLAPKSTAHQVNTHTTKTIIYSTLCIAFAELLIILT